MRWRRSLAQLLPGEGEPDQVGRRAGHPHPRPTNHRSPQLPQFDLVLAHQSLGDLPTDLARATAVSLLWRLTRPGGVLLMSEFGDPYGFFTVRCGRQLLLDESHRLQAALAAAHPGLVPEPATAPMSLRLVAAEEKIRLREARRQRMLVRRAVGCVKGVYLPSLTTRPPTTSAFGTSSLPPWSAVGSAPPPICRHRPPRSRALCTRPIGFQTP